MNRRRQSMLIGPDFFMSEGKIKKGKKPSNEAIERVEDDEEMDAIEEAAAKAYAEKTRRASAYPFQKAFTYDVSDSD